MKKRLDVSTLGEKPGSATIEAEDRKCEHLDECQLSKVVLYHKDECRTCDISTKFGR